MKFEKNLGKTLLTLLSTLTVPVMAAEAVDFLPFKYASTAKPPRMTYTGKVKAKNRRPAPVVINGKKAIMNPGGGGGIYASSKSPFHLCSAPGTYMITLAGEISGDANRIDITTNFNKKGQGNGTAGKDRANFEVKAGSFIRTLEFTVPPETAGTQYIFGVNGSREAKWHLTRLTTEFAPDNVEIKKITPQFNTMPSRWKNAAQADCFFTTSNASAAKTRTAVKIAYDDTNLYAGFIASEPEMKLISAKITERDGKLWNDDCVEFFFFDPVSDLGKQFIVNPANAQFDCELRQAQAGDPYKSKPWDGKWQSKTWKRKNSWEVGYLVL